MIAWITYPRRNSGKTIGKDLTEGKITLPLIHTLRSSSTGERERIAQIIKNSQRQETDLNYVMKTIQECGGIDYTMKQAQEFVAKAKASLSPFLPSKEKEALLTISDYAIRRKW